VTGPGPAGGPAGAEGLVARLTRAGSTVAVAESLTGGLLCARLVDVPGASAVVRGGVVAYATELKAVLLGVDAGLLAERGPVDPDVALAMAAGVRARLAADWGVATTGVAGPEPQDGVPPGTVYVAVCGPGGGPGSPAGAPDGQVRRLVLAGDRAAVREGTVAAALALLAERLEHGATAGS
jgi:nicotinamide-nucleotide amidase